VFGMSSFKIAVAMMGFYTDGVWFDRTPTASGTPFGRNTPFAEWDDEVLTA